MRLTTIHIGPESNFTNKHVCLQTPYLQRASPWTACLLTSVANLREHSVRRGSRAKMWIARAYPWLYYQYMLPPWVQVLTIVLTSRVWICTPRSLCHWKNTAISSSYYLHTSKTYSTSNNKQTCSWRGFCLQTTPPPRAPTTLGF